MIVFLGHHCRAACDRSSRPSYRQVCDLCIMMYVSFGPPLLIEMMAMSLGSTVMNDLIGCLPLERDYEC